MYPQTPDTLQWIYRQRQSELLETARKSHAPRVWRARLARALRLTAARLERPARPQEPARSSVVLRPVN